MNVPKCPEHKIDMVVKTAKGGEYKGQRFYVCPMYPDCKIHIKCDEYLEKFSHTTEGKLANLQRRKEALIRRKRITF